MTSPLQQPYEPPISYPGLPDPAPLAPAPYHYQYPPPVIEQRTSQLAVAALVVAIVGGATFMCTFGVPSLVAVFLGHLAFLSTRKGGKPGRWLAVAALVLGYATVALSVAMVISIRRS